MPFSGIKTVEPFQIEYRFKDRKNPGTINGHWAGKTVKCIKALLVRCIVPAKMNGI
jgi:hypothetical protein